MRYVSIALSVAFLTFLSCKSTEQGLSGRTGKDAGQNPPLPSDSTAPNDAESDLPSGNDAIGILTPSPNFKIAYLGDQGLGSKPESVLNLVKAEGTDLLMIAGDFDYKDSPND